MKKKITLIFLISSMIAFSQNSSKETEEFFKIIKCKQIINNVFGGVKTTFKSETKAIFENEGLDYNIVEDVEQFNNFLNEEIELFSEDTYSKIFNLYSTEYTGKEIESFIELSKSDEGKSDVLEKSNFKSELTSIINEFKGYLINDINLTLNRIKAKYKPLKLILIVDGNELNSVDNKLDLFLNLKINGENSISILDKKTLEIQLPKDFDYSSFTSLTIKYKENNYIIERYNMNLPEMVREISSPLKKECFEELENWTLRIDNDVISFETNVEVIIRNQ